MFHNNPRTLVQLMFAVLSGLLIAGIGAAKPLQPVPDRKKDAKAEKPFPKAEDGTFTEIVVGGGGNLVIRQSGKENIAHDGPPGLNAHTIEKGVLYLNAGVNFEIDIKYLNKIVLKSGGNIEIRDLYLKNLSVTLAAGVGKVIMAGRVDEQTFEVCAIGDIDGVNLKGKRIDATVRGIGNIFVNPSEHLKATVFGIGNIEYVNRPAELQENAAGMGKIRLYDPSRPKGQ